MNLDDYIKIGDALGVVIVNALNARAEARRLAEQAGVSPADLDAADDRAARTYIAAGE